jgi:hypothetical protein
VSKVSTVVLVDMYLVIPPSWIMTSWILEGMLIFLSLPDKGFLNLIWLRVLAFLRARTLLRVLSNTFSWFLTVLRGSLALHSSTAALLSSFQGFSWHVFFHFTGLESAINWLLDKQLPNKKFLS